MNLMPNFVTTAGRNWKCPAPNAEKQIGLEVSFAKNVLMIQESLKKPLL
jgi:hypothetical protein